MSLEDNILEGGLDGGEAMANSENINKLNKTIKETASTTGVDITTDDIVRSSLTDSELDQMDMSSLTPEAASNMAAFQKMLQGGDGTSDFEMQFSDPTLLPSSEQFLTKTQPIRVGTYSGKVIGNVPIFAPPAALIPFNIKQQRQANLSKAAAKRSKKAKEALSLLNFDVPEQWQNEMNDMKANLIDQYGKATGYNFYKLLDKSSKLGREFSRDLDRMNAIDKSITELDTKARAVLKAVSEQAEYVPDEVFDAARRIANGSRDKYSIEYFMTDQGTKDFNNLINTVQTYENRNKILNSQVIDKIQANIRPTFASRWEAMNDEEKTEFSNLYETYKLGGNQGKVAMTKFVNKYFGEEDIRIAVTEVLSNSNVYKKSDKEALEKSIEYVNSMLGDAIDAQTTISQLYEAYSSKRPSGGGGTPDTTIYSNIANGYNNTQTSSQGVIKNELTNKDKTDAEKIQAIKKAGDELLKQMKLSPDGDFHATITTAGSNASPINGAQISTQDSNIRYNGMTATGYIEENLPSLSWDKDENKVIGDEKTINTIQRIIGRDLTQSDIGKTTIAIDPSARFENRTFQMSSQELVFVDKDGNDVNSESLLNKYNEFVNAGLLDDQAIQKTLEYFNSAHPTVRVNGVMQEGIYIKKNVQTGEEEVISISDMLNFGSQTPSARSYRVDNLATITYDYDMTDQNNINLLDALLAKRNTQYRYDESTQSFVKGAQEPDVVKTNNDVSTDEVINLDQ